MNEPMARHELGATLGESPVWCERTGRLWFVDIRAPAVLALDPATGELQRFPMPGLAGMVALAMGGLVVGVGCSIHPFDPATGRLADPLAVLDADRPGNRINDTKAGPDGALWCGTMQDGGGASTGRLHHVEPTGFARELLDGIRCPNAIAFSPDGRTLYFTDTRQGEILQAAVPTGDEKLGLRPFAPADIAPGAPDGSTVDAEGCLWNARYGGSAIVRLDPDGRLMSTLHLPVSQPTACAFGGPDRRTLYVTSARQRLSPAALEGEPMAGDLLAFDVGVAGLPEPRFGDASKADL
ncbi:MAG: SMP-30/gluconolactonase/LRE family protein [Geminicoccaceae bacterium]|nr:SMP-30/gluconolactonase/LRE family protein [Geminicoccaceae bacterium]HRY25723.1 SMP-30/gluconolactonase/LRE family protein [Geminicoccaceae bacterium]